MESALTSATTKYFRPETYTGFHFFVFPFTISSIKKKKRIWGTQI